MARGGGSIRPDGVYHIISRFVGKQWFMKGETERRAYLSLLGLSIVETDWRLIAYALMSSHLHLAFVTGVTRLATWMQPMHTEFANWLNGRLERIGSIFVKGPNVVAYRPEGTAKLIQYIHSNPVRARVVAHPGDSDWTSYRAYAGTAPRQAWLDVETGLELAGAAASPDWLNVTSVTKEEVDEMRLVPKPRPGRPKSSEPAIRAEVGGPDTHPRSSRTRRRRAA